MSNTTEIATMVEDIGTSDSNLPTSLESYIWITGILLSSLCLILQVSFYMLIPKIRKIDQKVLTQLTVARLTNSILEFVLDKSMFHNYTKDLTFALYTQTDAVLICWMFVYTKILYEKVVQVFVLQKWNFIVLSLLIWILTIPIGVLCPIFLAFFIQHFSIYYKVYAWVKFTVLTLNVLFFGRIFYVIISRNRNTKPILSEIIKTCVISFILVCITSLQVFVGDIISYLEVSQTVSYYFCIVNSYQVIAVTIIFVILSKNNFRSASAYTSRSDIKETTLA